MFVYIFHTCLVRYCRVDAVSGEKQTVISVRWYVFHEVVEHWSHNWERPNSVKLCYRCAENIFQQYISHRQRRCACRIVQICLSLPWFHLRTSSEINGCRLDGFLGIYFFGSPWLFLELSLPCGDCRRIGLPLPATSWCWLITWGQWKTWCNGNFVTHIAHNQDAYINIHLSLSQLHTPTVGYLFVQNIPLHVSLFKKGSLFPTWTPWNMYGS